MIVEENSRATRSVRQQQELAEADEEMSDAATEGENEAQAQRQPHSAPTPQPPARRHDRLINQQIIAAWQQGHRLDPEIEQFLKEQSERGTLHANLDVVSNFHPRALRGYLRLAGAGTNAAAAASGAIATQRAAA